MINKKRKEFNPRKQWAKFIIVTLLYLTFLLWVKSWWGLLVLPFIYDAYISKKIRWQWWKDAEGPTRFIMSWVDALVFALVAVYFINLFFFQNFVIPSSSLEKSLLTGDYLFVSKVSYGPRIPQTPLTMPLTQHTLPLINTKSYIEVPHWDYRRVKGLGNVKLNDIVVFNYPDDSVHVSIDRKDSYVKRAVAVAGDVLEIKAGKLFINGKPEQKMGDAEIQQAYNVNAKTQLDIPHLYQNVGFLPVREFQTSDGFSYSFSGLTPTLAQEIKEIPGVTSIEPAIEPKGVQDISMHLNLKKSQEEQRIIYTDKVDISNTIFPMNKVWNKDWYGPIKIPKKGDIIDINLETIPMYSKLIREYENNILEVKGNQIFINKVAADKYEVKQNYYFMMGDNRDASLDSRYFGFVPETYIMGSPMFTWLSLEGSFTDNNSSYQANGWRIRWDRMFKATNTGEANKTSYWWVAAILMGIFFGWDYIMKFVKKKKNEE